MANTSGDVNHFELGDWVEGGTEGSADYDWGQVIGFSDVNQVAVAWHSGAKTRQPAGVLRPYILRSPYPGFSS